MQIKHVAGVAIALLLLPPVVAAEQLLPGLWEISAPKITVDGQPLPGMEMMLEQMQNLPPEQRQMMQQMMAKQGVQMAGQGLHICLSEAQVKAQELPLPEQKSGCTQETLERSASVWRFRYHCPDSDGEGETQFISDKAFSTQVRSRSMKDGKVQNSTMDSQGHWLAADCAGLPSRQ
jgi:hypothetical protein